MEAFSDGQIARKIRALLKALQSFERPNSTSRARGKRPSLLSAAQRTTLDVYLRAHEQVLLARGKLGAEWQVDLELLRLDAEYQTLRSNLRYQSGIAPGLAHLSGARSAASKLLAVHKLTEQLSPGIRKQRVKSSSTFTHKASGALKWVRKPEFRKIVSSQQKRAEALGPALAAYHSLSHASLEGMIPSGPGGTGSGGTDAWAENVVRINRNGFAGTGFFVTSTLIVTAAHVVHTPGTPPPQASELSIQLSDGSSSDVLAVTLNPSWNANSPTLDTALLAVSAIDGLGLSVLWDFGNHISTEVARYGYPANPSEDGYGAGIVQRAGPTFITSDGAMQIPAGASGCPLLYVSNGITQAVGIGTARSNNTSASATFIGLPMLHQLLPGF
jgi:hypothetical protein